MSGNGEVALPRLACCVAAPCVGCRFYSHYYIPAVAATLVALGVFGISLRGLRIAFVAIAIVAGLATIRGIPSYVHFASARTMRAQRIGNAIVARLGPGMSIAVPDDYAPELYLYADASLRDPYEIVAGPNAAFLKRLHLRIAPAALTILVQPSSPSPAGERAVCRTTAAPWRIFTDPARATRLGSCP